VTEVSQSLADQVAKAELAKLRAEKRLLDIQIAHKTREDSLESSCSLENGHYSFCTPVSGMAVLSCIHTTNQWVRRFPMSPITILINSPGGNLIDGLALFDHLKQLEASGTHVTTSCLGYAASMGAVLMQAGSHRVIGRNAYLMIHEVAYGTAGKTSEMEDDVNLMKRLQANTLSILAERSTLSERQIKARWARKDWWLNAEESLAAGFVDEIL